MKKRFLPFHAVRQPGKAVLAVGGIDVHQIKPGIFGRNHASLMIHGIHPDAVGYAVRYPAAEKRRTAVAFLFRAEPVLFIPVQGKSHLSRLTLGLLQTDHVRIESLYAVKKSFSKTCSDPVYIPGYHSHHSITLPHLISFPCLIQPSRPGSSAGRRELPAGPGTLYFPCFFLGYSAQNAVSGRDYSQ